MNDDARTPGTAPPPAHSSDLFSLAGRVVLITGASGGLGRRAALTFATAGAHVLAVARRADRLADLAAEHPRITAMTCDVSDAQARVGLVAEAMSRHGTVDVLVNNAGVAGPTDAFAEDLESFHAVLSVNLVASFHLARLVVEQRPHDAQTSTSIINVSSILGLVAGHPVGGAAYTASKAGLIGLTRELAAQWGPRGVRVNSLAPGWFPTEMNTELFASSKFTSWIARNSLLQRPGNPDELDGALLFLASDASTYVTGQTIVVDGGWTAR